ARQSHQSTSNLRIIFQDTVDNVETRGLIKKAQTSPSSYTQGDDSGYRVYTDIDEGFYAILGSPNGGVVMHMLDDHKHHVGLRYVEKVVVLGAAEGQNHRHFYFVLSEKRHVGSPPT
ncbi:hypothetical protein F5883DRAFT_437940, partial [Diaporthe sp. PMI_573]